MNLEKDMLPKDPTFWIIVAIGVTLVVLAAIWWGRGLEIGKWYIRVKAAEPKEGGGTSVLRKASMRNVKVGGSIVGTQTSGLQTPSAPKNVDVLDRSRMTDVEIGGDIMGEKRDGETGSKS